MRPARRLTHPHIHSPAHRPSIPYVRHREGKIIVGMGFFVNIINSMIMTGAIWRDVRASSRVDRVRRQRAFALARHAVISDFRAVWGQSGLRLSQRPSPVSEGRTRQASYCGASRRELGTSMSKPVKSEARRYRDIPNIYSASSFHEAPCDLIRAGPSHPYGLHVAMSPSGSGLCIPLPWSRSGRARLLRFP